MWILLVIALFCFSLIRGEKFSSKVSLPFQTSDYTCPSTKFLSYVHKTCHVPQKQKAYITIALSTLDNFQITSNYSYGSVDIHPNAPNASQSAIDPVISFSTSPYDISYVNQLVGIALDGIPIYTALDSSGQDILFSQHLVLDQCGGTFGHLPQFGYQYHYRVLPACLYLSKSKAQLRRQQNITDVSELFDIYSTFNFSNIPKVVGYSLAGVPIYSPYTSRGLLQSQLDSCNGKFISTVISGQTSFQYQYYATPTFPYLIGCIGPGTLSLTQYHTSSQEVFSQTISHQAPSICPQGTYLSSIHPTVTTNRCIPCPAGKYAQSSYSIGNRHSCNGIPSPGSYSIAGSTSSIPCPAGRFGSVSGLNSTLCSGPCSPGYFCPEGSIQSNQYPCGNYSFYCPEGSSTRQVVSLGYYSIPDDINESIRSNQIPCPPGSYCIAGRKYPCPIGRYGSESFLSSSNCSSDCPKGSYCPLGSIQPILCPAGRYGSSMNLSNVLCSGECAKGHYCPAGSVSSTEIPCRGGIYGPSEGLTNPSCSLQCNDNDTYCSINYCEEGYYCPPGSFHSQQYPCGSSNVYCPRGSTSPLPVELGYYTIGKLSRPNELQSILDNTTRSHQILCEPGFYCESFTGIKTPCPPGKYGSTYGLYNSECSGDCDGGYYCQSGSSNPKQFICGNSSQFYCPKGSFQPTLVPIGYYAINTSNTDFTYSAIELCVPGSYCVEGRSFLCPEGRYSVHGANSSNCDGFCESGYYCPAGSISSTQVPCPAGRYGGIGMINDNCDGPCAAGYYCPSNSSSPTQFQCGGETVYCPIGSSLPLAVDLYHYSIGGSRMTRSGQQRCIYNDTLGTPPEGHVRLNVCPSTTVWP